MKLYNQVCSWRRPEDSLQREPPGLGSPAQLGGIWYQYNLRFIRSDFDHERRSFSFAFNVVNNRRNCLRLCLEYLETHRTKTVMKVSLVNISINCLNWSSYMEKYTYHHYHPKLTNELFSERDNSSIHFYSRNKGARITKSSHFR